MRIWATAVVTCALAACVPRALLQDQTVELAKRDVDMAHVVASATTDAFHASVATLDLERQLSTTVEGFRTLNAEHETLARRVQDAANALDEAGYVPGDASLEAMDRIASGVSVLEAVPGADEPGVVNVTFDRDGDGLHDAGAHFRAEDAHEFALEVLSAVATERVLDSEPEYAVFFDPLPSLRTPATYAHELDIELAERRATFIGVAAEARTGSDEEWTAIGGGGGAAATVILRTPYYYDEFVLVGRCPTSDCEPAVLTFGTISTGADSSAEQLLSEFFDSNGDTIGVVSRDVHLEWGMAADPIGWENEDGYLVRQQGADTVVTWGFLNTNRMSRFEDKVGEYVVDGFLVIATAAARIVMERGVPSRIELYDPRVAHRFLEDDEPVDVSLESRLLEMPSGEPDRRVPLHVVHRGVDAIDPDAFGR